VAAAGAAVLALGGGALASGSTSKAATALGPYRTHNLVSDQAGKADLRDPSLVDAWGLDFGTDPATPGWVANAGTGVSTLYTGDTAGKKVAKVPLTVKIPGGAPAGTVFNDTKGFMPTRRPASPAVPSRASRSRTAPRALACMQPT
jgi:hypothetical protein